MYVSGANLTNLSSYKQMSLEGGKLKVQEENGCCCVYKIRRKNLSCTCDSTLSCVQNAAMDQKHLCKVATHIHICPKYAKKHSDQLFLALLCQFFSLLFKILSRERNHSFQRRKWKYVIFLNHREKTPWSRDRVYPLNFLVPCIIPEYFALEHQS